MMAIIIFFIVFYLFRLDFAAFYVGAGLTAIYVLFSALMRFIFDAKRDRTLDGLERDNEKLTQELGKQHEKQRELEQYFLLWMHQMKTPITAGNLLLDGGRDFNIDDMKRQFLSIENYASLAMNYIQITSPDRDMDFASVKLHSLIVPVLQKYSIMFISKRIHLHYTEINDIVLTDPKLMRIVIEQLISNALKYTEAGGDIWIAYDAECHSLSVKDNGIGILPENLDKIFDKGYAGFNGHLNDKSSGIGLYLARQITNRLNHRIDVASQLGEGSTFKIVF